MASSSSFSSDQPNYQIFLSFRGPDTRRNFTAHLLSALKDRGLIAVFFDEEKLEIGEDLLPTLLKAISESKISLIVLSKDYASSKSCLIELSKIMECKVTNGQLVVPIFYHVDPSDVRNIAGSFKDSFENMHQKQKLDEVERWKDAFTQVGELKGWHIEGGNFDRSEPAYIENIVEDVIKKLNSKSTSCSEEWVGIDDQKEKILSLINQEDTRVIGIWGMGGIGKTTLAKAVYNEVFSSSKFSAHHFLQNVREKSLTKNGMKSLQVELLSKLLKQKVQIDTPSIRSTLVHYQLHNKRVFVVLDDVNSSLQVKGLGADYFGPGSKIIVTSRDKQVLKSCTELVVEIQIHEVRKLNGNDALQLFSRFAFKQYNPLADLRVLSSKFVLYAGGNPLALKVLGPRLYQKPRKEWESLLDKLKAYPEQNIKNVLKISFDGLDELGKNIFLDIACFFKKYSKKDLTELLNCCYKGVDFEISNLVDKCLIDVHPEYNTIEMHDLVEEMGRDIVRKESKFAGKRSRLWSLEDVSYVLKNNKGTELIQGISLMNMSNMDSLQISPTIFKKMVNLKFIKIDSSGCNKLLLGNQDLKYLPDELRYLYWREYPWKSLPSNFNPKNLVKLSLCHAKIEQLWDDNQNVPNLRVIDLRSCKNLRKIPNLLGAINLEGIYCQWCESLVELPCLTHLISLHNLRLDNCPITKFPEIPTNIEVLDLQRTQIEEVPSSIGSLKKLRSLDLRETKIQTLPSSIVMLDALEDILISNCPDITELNLSMTPMEEAPSLTPRLQSLTRLYASSCKSLKSLLGLPPLLEELDARYCTSLERVTFSDHGYLRELDYEPDFDFDSCSNLNQDAVDNIVAHRMMRIRSIAKQSAKQLIEKWEADDEEQWDALKFIGDELLSCLPGSEISDLFENQQYSSSITVKLSLASASSRRFLGFALCLVVDFVEDLDEYWHDVVIHAEYKLKGINGHYEKIKRKWDCRKLEINYTEGKPMPENCSNDHVLLLFRSDMIHRDMHYKKASFKFHVTLSDIDDRRHLHCYDLFHVKKCGVHVFYVDAEDFTVTDVESSINFSSDAESFTDSDVDSSSSDEDNISYSLNITSPNSPVSPNWFSQEFDGNNNDQDFGESMIEEDANVGNNDHGEDPATTVSRLGSKRSFSSEDEEYHQPDKRVK